MGKLEFWMQFFKIVLMVAAFLIGLSLYFRIIEVLKVIELFILSQ